MHIYCLVFPPSLQPHVSHVSHLQLLKLRHTQVLHRRKPAGTTGSLRWKFHDFHGWSILGSMIEEPAQCSIMIIMCGAHLPKSSKSNTFMKFNWKLVLHQHGECCVRGQQWTGMGMSLLHANSESSEWIETDRPMANNQVLWMQDWYRQEKYPDEATSMGSSGTCTHLPSGWVYLAISHLAISITAGP